MPPLICASPTLLDQTFPRNSEELNLIADALGELQACLEEDLAHVVLTGYLRLTVEDFDWERVNAHPRLGTIRQLLIQWFLQQHDRLVELDVDDELPYQSHLIPPGCEGQGLTDFWADEVGRLLARHDRSFGPAFCVGIACPHALAGEPRGEYGGDANRRVFPLVGREELLQLEDAYHRPVPPDMHRRDVSFRDAYKHLYLLGATKIDKPSGAGGSHHMVRFRGQRSWPLDSNTDPIPERFLRELQPLCGYPINVIKFALIEGYLPDPVLRF